MSRTYVLRHGQSTANVAGIIVSAPGKRALEEVGLSELGREQARAAGARARELGLGEDTVVVSSDFARARETAVLFAAELGAAPARLDPRLRERHFGEHDGGPDSAYDLVWAADASHRPAGEKVESVPSVAARVTAAREEAEEFAGEAPVVLVSHGDVLQVALALGAGSDPHDHRGMPHLGTAELRELGSPRPSR